MEKLNKQIEKLNKTLVKWGCHYQVYDCDGYTVEELLMQFFYKINEIIGNVNEYSKLVSALIEWIIGEGLKDAVSDKLDEMKQDGSLADVINKQIFQDLNNRIEDIALSFEDYKILIRSELDNFESEMQEKLDTAKEEIESLVDKVERDYIEADNQINNKLDDVISELNSLSAITFKDFERKIFDIYGLKPNGEISTPIQNFINSVKSGDDNGVIYIPEGTYTWDNEVIDVNNVHIIAHPKAYFKRTNVNASGFFLNGIHGASYVGRTAGSNITVDGGVWDANTTVIGGNCCAFNLGIGTNIVVKNAKFINFKGNHTFDISGCDGVTIDNCYFGGREAVEGENIEVIQIAPQTEGGFPQFGHNSEALGLNCINVTVKNCTFDKCSVAIGNHSGVYPGYEKYINIKGNVFNECTTVAIRADHWEKINIFDNKFYKMPQAILLRGSHALPDIGREYSLSCQDITISNNIFYECNSDDVNASLIYAKGYKGASESTTYTGYVNNLIITNNIFKNIKKGRCIWVTLGKKVTIGNNTASCFNFARLGSVENLSITGNSIEAEGKQVIILSMDNVPYSQTRGCAYGVISGNSIVGRLGTLISIVRCHHIDVNSNKLIFRGQDDEIRAIHFNTSCEKCSALSNSCSCNVTHNKPIFLVDSTSSYIMLGMNLSYGVTGETTSNNSANGGVFKPTFQ